MASIETYWNLYSTYYGHTSLHNFQRFAGLPISGSLDEATMERLYAPRCGVSDALRATLDAKWRKKRLNYYVQSYVEGVGISPAVVGDVIRAAWKSWEDAADIKFSQVNSDVQADLILSTGRGPRAGFDGPQGTLAWAKLPAGDDRPLLMRFDLAESWVNDPNRDIYLLCVAAHEFGHLLGLDHDTQGSGALMAPFYNRAVTKPQAHDVARIQGLYGPPASVPDPPPSPPPSPPGGSTVTREIIKAIIHGAIQALAAYSATTWNPLDDLAAKWAASKEDWLVDFILSKLPAGMPLTEAVVQSAFAEAVAQLRV